MDCFLLAFYIFRKTTNREFDRIDVREACDMLRGIDAHTVENPIECIFLALQEREMAQGTGSEGN